MKRFTLGAAALLLATFNTLASNETSFTYGGIYKSLKTAQKTEFSQLALNFYLRESGTANICPTTRVYLSDGEKSFDLSVTKEGKLLLPLDKKLKQDHAAITLVTDKPVTCHLAMEIAVAKYELEHVTPAKVNQWLSQFHAMYEKLAGWPGKYFMPRITGLKLVLADNAQGGGVYANGTEKTILAPPTETTFTIPVELIEQFAKNGKLTFGATIEKVTPILAK